MWEIKVIEKKDFIVLEIQLKELITPSDLPKILEDVQKKVGTKFFGKGVIISGRMPVWLFCALTHLFHPAKFVSTFDPRIQGAVIVASHDPERKLGDVIPLS